MNIFASLIIFYIGTALGSFISVVIYRIKHEKSGILFGRSHCTNCNKSLAAIDLLPIVSYISLNGKCRYCGSEIAPSYIFMEIFTGIIMALLYLHVPFLDFSQNVSLPGIMLPVFFQFMQLALVFLVLVGIFFYDLLYQEIPDIFTYVGIMLALLGNIIFSGVPPEEYIPGAAFGAFFFGIQLLVSKGKWVGSGDVILGLLMGILLGWKQLLLSLFIAYLLGSIVALWLLMTKKVEKNSKIPFAPFLVIGTILSVLFGSEMINWYFRILLV